MNNVNFAIRTNTVVPTSVHVVGVSTFPALVEIFPRYRDDSFFVVEDEIVIVDRGHRIVDVVPAGPRAHFGRADSATTTTVNLSEPEIREVQQVLIHRGFFHGRVDGVFGPETREALISFQRKEGFEATGSIDTRTVGALGLSARIGGNAQGDKNQSSSGQNQSGTQRSSGQAGTSGQAPASQQNSSEQTNPPAQNQSQNQPAKDQSNPSAQQQPSANNERGQNNQGGSSPSTTGQGDAQSQTSGSPHKRNSSDK